MHDSELIRRYTLDRAGIMFVTGLIKDLLTSPTPALKCHGARNRHNPYINIFGNWKNANMQAVIIWVCIWQHLQNRIVSLFIYYKIR